MADEAFIGIEAKPLTAIALPNPTGFAIEEWAFFKALQGAGSLPIPAHGKTPPLRFHRPDQLPAGVNRRALGIYLNELPAADILPPLP